MRILFLLIAALMLSNCNTARKVPKSQSRAELKVLKEYMTGTFNSSDQAKTDESFYDISLTMVPIWENEPGEWLYVEQAVSSNLEKPYRQRVYELMVRPDGHFESRVYTIDEPEKYIQAWTKVDGFSSFSPENIQLKGGCEVVLKYNGSNNLFEGSTGQKTCPSELRGASYATSKVEVSPTQIISWDQGFNDEGKQVWGAVKGGYIFVKQ